jgi:hypothetical protein
MPRRAFGYSIHVIHPNGAPAAVGFSRRQNKAVDLAEETAKATSLEVRVWNTRTARVVHLVPSPDCQEVA